MSVCTSRWGGDYCERETPVPIPNTVVKPPSSDDTVWATAWENRTLPLHPPVWAGFLFMHGLHSLAPQFYALHSEKLHSSSS